MEQTIAVGEILLQYCEPCEMPEPLPLRVRTLLVEQIDAPEHKMNIGGNWYTAAELANTTLPGVSDTEKAFLLESMQLANRPEFHLLINDQEQDLAYLYARNVSSAVPDQYRNLGVVLQCADGVSPVITFRFPDRKPERVKPPLPHFEEVTDHCYDGSCVLEKWKATQTATLFDDKSVNAGPVAGIMPGDTLTVERLVSEVRPVHATVVFDQGRFLAGDEIYVLNSLGEGYFRVWHYGRTVEEEVIGVSFDQACNPPSEECWAETEGYPEETWWGYVRTEDGKSGWLRNPESFVESVLELQ